MPATIATQLEEDGLHHRAQQIERVIAALKDRAVYRQAVTGSTPPGLQRAIVDFGVELRAIRRRLASRH